MPPGHAEVIREMVVPIMRKEKIVAILGIGNKPVEYTEKDVEIVSYLADIAYVIIERKRAEEEIRMLNAGLEKRVEERTAELREAHEKLLRQERLAVLGQLAGGVGHELRNPLAVMTNAVYFLRLIQPDADEKVKEYHRILENEIKNAEKIIRDLLDYARVPSTDRRPVKPYDLAAAAIERFPAPENIAVNMDIPLDLPFVRVDQRQIIQVLGNIFENAYQAMPGGGTMTVSAREKGDEVVIRVTDTGPGIASENLGRIFEPLFTTKTRGIGLGLAVSRKLTKANDGRLEAESEPGKGSTFALVLPLEKKEGRL
jgi:signal transduction histidine kinase